MFGFFIFIFFYVTIADGDMRSSKYHLYFLNPRLPKRVVTPPVCRQLYQNTKESDPVHLSNLCYILCGHFDERYPGIPTNTGIG